MNCPFQQKQEDRTKTMDYAMPADFCRMFEDRLDHLYTLALLLTADHHKAEQCLVAGLDDCLQGNPVFREWAHSWAKRTVVKNAIRIISPLKNKAEPAAGISEPDTLAAAITSLKPLDRFVYVLSVLEKYSDRECAMLLDSTVEKIVNARIRALQRIASVAGRNAPAELAGTRVTEGLRQVYGEAS
jgi:DNA-directed RNA polymerase specialized sigma24 family protein